MKVLSEFTGSGNHRAAQVVLDEGVYIVEFYYNDILIDRCHCEDHGLRYAEDVAENYVLEILKINRDTWTVHAKY